MKNNLGEKIVISEYFQYILEPIEVVINKGKNIMIIKKVANAFKIEFNDSDLDNPELRKKICDKIKHIRSTGNTPVLKPRAQSFSNDFTLMGDAVTNFSDKEIVIYTEDGKSWCFHASEVPMLIKSKKNPYTNREFSKEFIQNLIKTAVYCSQYTVDEAINTLFAEHPDDSGPTLKENMEMLEKYIKSFNPYIPMSDLPNIPINEYIEMFSMMNQHTPIRSMYYTRGLLDDTQFLEKLKKNFMTISISNIRRQLTPIPLISAIIDQVISDYLMVKSIVKIVSKELFLKHQPVFYTLSLSDLIILFGEENVNQIIEIFKSKVGEEGVEQYWHDLGHALSRHTL